MKKTSTRQKQQHNSSGNAEKNENIIEEDKNTMPIEIKEEKPQPQNKPEEKGESINTEKWKPENVNSGRIGKK